MTADRPVPVAHPDNRWTVERVVAEMTEHLDDSYAGQSTDHRLRDIVRWRDALAALNGPTTTPALPDVDQVADWLDASHPMGLNAIYGAMPAEFAEWTTRGQIEAVLAAVAALLAQTDTEDDQ